MKDICKLVDINKQGEVSRCCICISNFDKNKIKIEKIIYHDEWEDPNFCEHSITSSKIAVLEHVTDPQIKMLENCTCLGELKNVLSRNFSIYLDEFL